MRKWAVVTVLLVCTGGILLAFWQQELRYARPTPLPANYTLVKMNTPIAPVGQVKLPSGAAFLHFFNPDCPCSRFNLKHFHALNRQYGQQLHVVAVIPAYADYEKARQMLDEDVLLIQDDGDVLAQACGVYATPQAVVLDSAHTLFFRGNYNKSRYCTAKNTNYAALALHAFVTGQPAPVFDQFATTAYGCELPDSTEYLTFFN